MDKVGLMLSKVKTTDTIAVKDKDTVEATMALDELAFDIMAKNNAVGLTLEQLREDKKGGVHAKAWGVQNRKRY